MDILTVRHVMPPGGTMGSAPSALAKVIAGKRPKRRLRSAEEKKRIVEETMAKGASVARLAQAHGVHVSQIFDWRKEYRTEKQRAKKGRGVNLLPVAVLGNDGTIEIELAKGKVRIEERTRPCYGTCWRCCHDQPSGGNADLDCSGSHGPAALAVCKGALNTRK